MIHEEFLVESYEYDSCARVSRREERDGFSLENTYDKAGRLIKVTGSNGRVISYTYDSMGRVIETDDCGSITRFTYTGTGKIKSVKDALGNRTEYTYNELDLLCKIERIDPKYDNSFETTSDIHRGISDNNKALDTYDIDESDALAGNEYQFPTVNEKGHITLNMIYQENSS